MLLFIRSLWKSTFSIQAWKDLANFSKIAPSLFYKAGSWSLAARCWSLPGVFGNQHFPIRLGSTWPTFPKWPQAYSMRAEPWSLDAKSKSLSGAFGNQLFPIRLGRTWPIFPKWLQDYSIRLNLGAWLQNAGLYQKPLEFNFSQLGLEAPGNFFKMAPSIFCRAGSGSLAAKCFSLLKAFGNQLFPTRLGSTWPTFPK